MYYSVGAIFAGIAIQSIFRKVQIPLAIIMLTVLTILLLVSLAWFANEFIFYIMIGILGLTNAGTRVLRVTFLFSHVKNQVYGRANSVFALANISFRIFFLSIFATAFFYEENHIIYAFLIMAIFLLLTVFVLVKNYAKIISLQEIEE